ncbi:MAG: adenosylcobinamide-phosphate synthase CbiB [Litoreibacter sp.]|nr:adenosylcobinamide-phosphate synthase CbiB [Litoreibacter sp.]MCY4334824.1 adenosylcobinamide-phosphate synthase CbiB [Litoreibacter sp.]
MLAIAMVLDAIFGEPRWLWSRIPHPAVVIGNAIALFDRKLNRGPRRFMGVILVVILCLVSGVLGLAIEALPGGGVLSIVLAAILLAQRSLAEHVRDVARALRISLGDGRRAVAMIVGRDTDAMEVPDVARSAIESAAENLSDGVVAPAFWFLIAGLPGILIYKSVNTADSMVGYRTERYAAFGWASAKLDDVLNWVPARLTAILILIASLRFDLWSFVRRDAPLHRSPNAGWPEAAMAGVLGTSLSGPRSYHGERKDFPFVYPEGRKDLRPSDIDACVAMLWRSWAVLFGVAVLVAIA